MKVKEWIEELRKLMVQNKVNAYIVPSQDSHLSEYVADHWKSRKWISGFTGSAGTVVITLDDAGLWTDGRYYIQAASELLDSGIKLFKMSEPGVPSYTEWLNTSLVNGDIVGLDGSVFSVDSIRSMEKTFKDKGIILNIDNDLIDTLWKDRPDIPNGDVFLHDTKYAGLSRSEKIGQVRKEMKLKGATYYLLSSLDDIAWLLNIRGKDVPNNPIVISYLLVGEDKSYLFVDPSKVSAEITSLLKEEGVELKDYLSIQDYLTKLTNNDTILYDSAKTNAALYKSINSKVKKLEAPNITTKLKAIKNETEIRNLHTCQISDGIVMVKFIKWLKESITSNRITEISAADKLHELRSQQDLFFDLSFDTIAAYMDHGAMMHYSAKEASQYTLRDEGFFLVDSGGQYFNGTTDITRTIVLGKLTEEEKRDFTLVLKAHIALTTIKFLKGTTGSNLDIIARKPIWEYGMDYKCGTGHGVGFFLNVHEGPQNISKGPSTVALEKGMILTNEPGIYKEGQYGIRTENMMLVIEDEKNGTDQFLKFKYITYCPIDLQGIDIGLLTDEEKKWLNDYHEDVYTTLSPHLSEEERKWLRSETMRI